MAQQDLQQVLDPMNQRVGSKIGPAVLAAAAQGLTFQESRQSGLVHYRLNDEHYRVAISVECGKWFGLAVEVRSRKGRSVVYQFDSDLYDIESDRHREFGLELEADVVAFLDNLASGEVSIANHRGELTMIVPQARDVALVRRRRLMTETQTFAPADVPSVAGPLVPLRHWQG